MSFRRLGDIALSLVLLFVCLPVFVLAVILVTFELAALPLHRIERVTRDGRIVGLYRFRISRETRFGAKLTASGAVLRRFHLDQLPQLFNVLNGELSLLTPDGTWHDASGTKKAFALRQP